jgi:hypothetical protein
LGVMVEIIAIVGGDVVRALSVKVWDQIVET